LAELTKCGFMPTELFAAGYATCAEYKDLGFTLGELCSTGQPDGTPFSSRELATAMGWGNIESHVADLRNSGAGWALRQFH
jgi:hypothetical protein